MHLRKHTHNASVKKKNFRRHRVSDFTVRHSKESIKTKKQSLVFFSQIFKYVLQSIQAVYGL